MTNPRDALVKYDRYRETTLNLIPSENILSKDVLKALGSPMAGRYAGRPESYGGAALFHKLWEECEELATQVFDCKAASVAPISGHVAGMMALDAVTRRGDSIGVVPASNGGYKGYTEGFIPDVMGLNVLTLPYDETSRNIDLKRALQLIESEKPSGVVLGGTVFLFPHPVKEISEAVHEYGGKVIYDGSHVLGLVAGGEFQKPLEEGADLVLGSTHKTLFGPQGGIILSNDEAMIRKIEDRYVYRFLDNIHLNRIAALAIALQEMKRHRRKYARSIVRNSKKLAGELYERGLPVAGKDAGFTKSHQVLLSYPNTGELIRDTLESNLIICDSRVRLGTNEVTRKGMGEHEMKQISEMVSKGVAKQKSAHVAKSVRDLVSGFKDVRYTLEN
jgi:glycine hydroxymethyltransferase